MTEITFLSVSLEFESSCVRNVNHLAFQAGCLSVSSMGACVSTAVLLYKTVGALRRVVDGLSTSARLQDLWSNGRTSRSMSTPAAPIYRPRRRHSRMLSSDDSGIYV